MLRRTLPILLSSLLVACGGEPPGPTPTTPQMVFEVSMAACMASCPISRVEIYVARNTGRVVDTCLLKRERTNSPTGTQWLHGLNVKEGDPLYVGLLAFCGREVTCARCLALQSVTVKHGAKVTLSPSVTPSCQPLPPTALVPACP